MVNVGTLRLQVCPKISGFPRSNPMTVWDGIDLRILRDGFWILRGMEYLPI